MSKKIPEITHFTNDEKIMNRARKWNIERFAVNTDAESKDIGEDGDVLFNGYNIFFYFPPDELDEARPTQYAQQLEEDFKEVLCIRYTLNIIDIELQLLNNVDMSSVDEDIINKKNMTLGFKKLKRLETLYKLLIEIGLRMLHTYWWTDFLKHQSSTETLKENLMKVMPIVLHIKKQFEAQVANELPIDVIKKLKSNY